MSKRISFKNGRAGLALIALALFLGCGSIASAGASKPSAPSKPASAPKPAAKPAGGGSAGASHGSTTTGTHTTGTHTTTTGTHTTTTTSAHTTTTTGGGSHPTTTPSTHVGTGSSTAGKGPIHTAAPRGSTEHITKSGGAVRTRADGRVSDVHDARRGMDIHHGLDGSRRVSMERPGHGRLYAERGRRGYVQRGYSYHGRDFGRRSYYYHGREYDRYYRGYGYRGLYLNVYAPGYYYGPGFYGWAYNPWAAPIAYGWGWGGSPWFGFYGGYFAPYPVYPSAAFWLTDYIISQDLQAAYAARQEAAAAAAANADAAAAGGPPALTPDVKQMIADEVKAQLALENAEAQQTAQHQDVDPGSSGVARLLSDGHPHVFVVGGGLDLTDSTGQECAVSEGDALQLTTPPPADATTANLVVLASKGGKECQKTSTVVVNLTDMQEMQNHMRETIDQGLQDLQAKQGKDGLPQAPPSAQTKPVQTEYASIAPPPDPQDATDLQQQTQQADQVEKEVTAEAAPDGSSPAAAPAPAPAPTASIALGQTPDQVVASLGPPRRKADLPGKQIYFYDGMKITFKDGKVTDVE